MCCTLSTRRQTGAPINSWHPAAKRDWPRCGVRTTRRGRVRQSYLPARGYRSRMGRLLAFEAPEEVRILRGHTRCPGAIPFLQVVRCQSIHVLAGNKRYRVTYLVRRECRYWVPQAKATRRRTTATRAHGCRAERLAGPSTAAFPA